MSLLVFDSGIGGFSILRELRIALPQVPVTYVADDAGFPYGDWEEAALCEHIVKLFEALIAAHNPKLCVIACNTATTIAIEALRQNFNNVQFVGTVPAIKPAAESTASGLVTILATPGTIKRAYTQELIEKFASHCDVNLVGAPRLAFLAERHITGEQVALEDIKGEIAGCFVQRDAKRTDIVVLGCTHYPFVANLMRKCAPWPVDWVNPAEAIAQRAKQVFLAEGKGIALTRDNAQDKVIFTSNGPSAPMKRLALSFGLHPYL